MSFYEEGENFDDFDQALAAFFEHTNGDKPMDADKYHDQALAFLCGSVSAMNVLSVKLRKSAGAPELTAEQRIAYAVVKTNTEALVLAGNEYERFQRGKSNRN